jgi:hypothetical protein
MYVNVAFTPFRGRVNRRSGVRKSLTLVALVIRSASGYHFPLAMIGRAEAVYFSEL